MDHSGGHIMIVLGQLTWKLFSTEVADNLDLKMFHPVVLIEVGFSVGGVAAEVALYILLFGWNLADAWGEQLGENRLLLAPLRQCLCILDPFWDALWWQPCDAVLHPQGICSLLSWKSKDAKSWGLPVGWVRALVQCHLCLNFHLGVWFQCEEKAALHLATSSERGKTGHRCFILGRFWRNCRKPPHIALTIYGTVEYTLSIRLYWIFTENPFRTEHLKCGSGSPIILWAQRRPK